MKKSEFKEYLKNEILKMNEATDEEINKQKELNKELEKTKELEASMNEATDEEVKKQQELNKELEKTKELTASMKEGKIKKSEFKEYLRNEILREINEQEEDSEAEENISIGDLDVTDEVDFDLDPTETSNTDELDAISDELVSLARKAKNSGEIELANQILNSAKFAAKTQFKDVEAK